PVARRRPQHPRGDHRIGRGAPAPDPDDLDRDHGRRGAAGGRRRPRLGQSRDDRRRGDLRCRLLDAAVAVRGAGVLRPAGPVHALAARGRARTARARSGRAPGRGGVMPAPAAAATRRGIHALHALAVLYVAAAVAAMAWLSPRVPYADAWRHLGRYLALPFPRDVLAPDNGHQEILPNLVRVAELRLFEGGQWLQIAVGIALALLTLATCWRALRGLEPARRAAAWLGAVLGVCWLGNIRALAHANESVHAYSVTLLVAIGLLALARARPADVLARTALAAACGLGAAFSFGSGIAAFAAFAAVLLLRRAHWREWAVLLAGLATTLVLVQWNGGGTPSPEWAPLRQLDLWLRWLAGPFVYAAWPVLDPAIATHVPLAAVRVPALAIANAYEGAAGPVMLARWPHLGLGLAGLGGLGALAWKTWRQPGPAALFGLGLSCF